MDLATYAMAAFVLIGLVNWIQLALTRDWRGFSLATMAIAAGLLFGAIKWFGLPSAEIGLAVGISSSGVYKLAQKLGGS